MALDIQQIRFLYRKRAGRYDLTANLYYLIGFREQHYRRQAVAALQLKRGATVVELGCGTGLNFPLLQRAVGPEGRIIGVDLTDGMLAEAERRVVRNGWRNVELVRIDAGSYVFPAGCNAILSTFALTLMSDYVRILRRGREAMASGGRFAVLDLKESTTAPRWLTWLMIHLTSPFGVTADLTERHPWEEIERSFPTVSFKEYYLGYVYLAVGVADRVGEAAATDPVHPPNL